MDKKTLNSRQGARPFTAELAVEQDFIVPDIKPDVKKILKIAATPVLNQVDWGQGRLTLSGELFVYICYLPEEGSTARGLELRLPFSDVIDCPQEPPCFPEIRLLRANCNLLNGRKLHLRVTLEVSATLAETRRAETCFPTDESDLRVRSKNITLCETIPVSERLVEFSEHLELPAHSAPIRELLSVCPNVIIQEYRPLPGRIAVSGVLSVETLYLPDSDPCRIARMEHELPFTEILEGEGINEDSSCFLKVLPCRFESGLYEDSDGDAHLVSIRYAFRLSADVVNLRTITVATDAFCISCPTEVQSVSLPVLCGCQTLHHTQALREPLSTRGVMEVCSVEVTPRMIHSTFADQTLTHTGELRVSALVLTDADGAPECINATIPFNIPQEVNTDCNPDAIHTQVHCDHLSYLLTEDGGIEIRPTLHIVTRLTCSCEVTILSDILQKDPAPQDTCQMVVYFTREEDCMWEIAKRYQRCPAQIAALNQLEENSCIPPHTALLIP